MGERDLDRETDGDDAEQADDERFEKRTGTLSKETLAPLA
jgi:hypothetical protein